MNTAQYEHLKAHLLVLIATGLVAGSFIASGKLAGVINPISLTLLRFVSSSLILLPFILTKSSWRRAILPTFPRAMIISLFYSLFFIGLFEALKTTTALNTGTLFTLVPLMTALITRVFFAEKLSKTQLLVYLLGALGTVWVIFKGDFTLLLSLSLNLGDIIFLLATLSMCFYSISMKLMYRNDDMMVLVFCTLVGGSMWMALALLIFGQDLEWGRLQGDSVYHMAYLVIGATLATVYLYQRTTLSLGPRRVNAYIYLNPALVAILSLMIDNTAIAAIIIPGVFISAFATLILQKYSATSDT